MLRMKIGKEKIQEYWDWLKVLYTEEDETI